MPFDSAEQFNKVQQEAQQKANESGLHQIAGYDSYSGWMFREFKHWQCQSDYELSEATVYQPLVNVHGEWLPGVRITDSDYLPLP